MPTIAAANPPAYRQEPLFSSRFLRRFAVGVAGLVAITTAASFAARTIGRDVSAAGYTASTQSLTIPIGQDAIRVPVNAIRFENQRKPEVHSSLDLFLTWPGMRGYSDAEKARFVDLSRQDDLLFLTLKPATMDLDMSGRYDAVYGRLITGPAQAGPAGLEGRRLDASSGYLDETLYSAPMDGSARYVVRCMDGSATAAGTCQRDIRVGRRLSVIYRFSPALLADWQRLDATVRAYVTARLQSGTVNPGDDLRQ